MLDFSVATNILNHKIYVKNFFGGRVVNMRAYAEYLTFKFQDGLT